jgi:hypothetical protein
MCLDTNFLIYILILYHVYHAFIFLPHQNEYFFVLVTSSKFAIFSTNNIFEPNVFKCVVKTNFTNLMKWTSF